MDSGLSTIRNVLYIVLVLAALSIAANLYLGNQVSRNSEELSRLGVLLQDQMQKSVVGQSEKLQEQMKQLHQDADSFDAKSQKAQDDFVKRMNKELPITMDNYFRTRAPMIERQVMKQVPR